MKYFLDTEFLEGKQTHGKPLFQFWLGKRPEPKPTIDLISIGIVAEDGREYYAISKDFNLKEAWNRYQMKQVSGDARNRYPEGVKEYWLRDNVLKPIFVEWKQEMNGKIIRLGLHTQLNDMKFNYKNFKHCIQYIGKPNKQITEEVCQFIDARWVDKSRPEKGFIYPCDGSCGPLHIHSTDVQFYAYYADYDWVAFCWLFGRMIDLPKGFPMYCNDLKQIFDEKSREAFEKAGQSLGLGYFKNMNNYPKQTGNHNALEDARWNKELYNFLQTTDFKVET